MEEKDGKEWVERKGGTGVGYVHTWRKEGWREGGG